METIKKRPPPWRHPMVGGSRNTTALMQMRRDVTACDLAENAEQLSLGVGEGVRRLKAKGYASRYVGMPQI